MPPKKWVKERSHSGYQRKRSATSFHRSQSNLHTDYVTSPHYIDAYDDVHDDFVDNDSTTSPSDMLGYTETSIDVPAGTMITGTVVVLKSPRRETSRSPTPGMRYPKFRPTNKVNGRGVNHRKANGNFDGKCRPRLMDYG